MASGTIVASNLSRSELRSAGRAEGGRAGVAGVAWRGVAGGGLRFFGVSGTAGRSTERDEKETAEGEGHIFLPTFLCGWLFGEVVLDMIFPLEKRDQLRCDAPRRPTRSVFRKRCRRWIPGASTTTSGLDHASVRSSVGSVKFKAKSMVGSLGAGSSNCTATFLPNLIFWLVLLRIRRHDAGMSRVVSTGQLKVFQPVGS